MRSPWHKMSSMFVCVQESTESDRCKWHKYTLSVSRTLTENVMTLMNASANRSNHNRSAKAIKERKKCHNSPVNRVNLDSSAASTRDFRWASTYEFHLLWHSCLLARGGHIRRFLIGCFFLIGTMGRWNQNSQLLQEYEGCLSAAIKPVDANPGLKLTDIFISLI